MRISRRQFLRTTAGSGIALGLGGFPLLATEQRKIPLGDGLLPAAGQPLRIPPTFSGDTITAAVTSQQVWSDIPSTQVWTFGGTYPSPTIRVKSGDQFAVQLRNQLADHTNIHWHGLVIPPDMDGHPKDAIHSGMTFDYAFKVDQRAGTYWYHPHAHMTVGQQVYMGMAGFFIVTDDEEQSLGLPSGEFDVPLLIQDRRLAKAREFNFAPETENDFLEGFLGDTVLVNGTPDPYLEVAQGLYRFRILNGSNARVYNLAFADRRPFYIIGTDAGLLDRPYDVTATTLAPAERIEILVDFSKDAIGNSVLFKTLNYGGASGTEPQQGTEMPIIRFDVTKAGSGSVTIPTTLANIERLDPARAERTRKFTMRIDHSTTPVGHTMNGKMFEMLRIDEEVPIGSTEIWTFENISFLQHSMHLHGALFQVLDRTGTTGLEPRDQGWKDTVWVRPFQTVRIIVPFAQWKGLLLVHCHNLEHEDMGMMLNFEMVDPQNTSVEESERTIPTVMDLR